jgi:hypothetical protein
MGLGFLAPSDFSGFAGPLGNYKLLPSSGLGNRQNVEPREYVSRANDPHKNSINQSVGAMRPTLRLA